jgi:hypothetical protein
MANLPAEDVVIRLRQMAAAGYAGWDVCLTAAEELERECTRRLQAQHERDCAVERIKQLSEALGGLMPFHPEDELGPGTRDYWAPAYRTAYEAAEAALQVTRSVTTTKGE